METAVQETPTVAKKKRGPKPKAVAVETSFSSESPTVIIKESGVEKVEFFGQADRNKDGKIASEVPAWYLRQHTEELGNSIDYMENQLERGLVPDSEKPLMRERVAQMKRKQDQINESQPKLEGKELDAISKIGDSLGKKISSSMFSRSDMMKGVADAHEEARRMADPCIELRGDEYTLAKKAGCRIDRDGKVSRNDAEKVWKLIKRSLGENSNTEILRRN